MRDSNFELLRILSMLFIIFGHFVGQSGMIDYYHYLNFPSFVVVFFESGARVATMLFLLLGCWFMVDSDFRPSKIIKLYSQLWFYVVTITIVLLVSGVPVPIKWKIGSFLPYTSNSLWFVCQYLNLMLLHPFLKRILEWDKRKLGILLLLLFFMIVVMSTIKKFQNSWVADLLFFQFTYLLVGYYKKHIHLSTRIGKVALPLGVGIYLVLVALKWFFNANDTGSGFFHYGSMIVTQYICDFKALPVFVSCCLIFIYFQNLNIGRISIINTAARSALAVYIIHQHPAFYMYLWKDIVSCDQWVGGQYGIFFLLLFVPLLYTVCSLVDCLRIKLIEPIWTDSRIYKFFNSKLELYYNDI